MSVHLLLVPFDKWNLEILCNKYNLGNKERIRLRSQSGKQCKPVQVHSFSRFSLWINLRKLLVGEASPIPFERYLRYRLLVHSERFCRYYFWTNCPEDTQTSIRKSKMSLLQHAKNENLLLAVYFRSGNELVARTWHDCIFRYFMLW